MIFVIIYCLHIVIHTKKLFNFMRNHGFPEGIKNHLSSNYNTTTYFKEKSNHKTYKRNIYYVGTYLNNVYHIL